MAGEMSLPRTWGSDELLSQLLVFSEGHHVDMLTDDKIRALYKGFPSGQNTLNLSNPKDAVALFLRLDAIAGRLAALEVADQANQAEVPAQPVKVQDFTALVKRTLAAQIKNLDADTLRSLAASRPRLSAEGAKALADVFAQEMDTISDKLLSPLLPNISDGLLSKNASDVSKAVDAARQVHIEHLGWTGATYTDASFVRAIGEHWKTAGLPMGELLLTFRGKEEVTREVRAEDGKKKKVALMSEDGSGTAVLKDKANAVSTAFERYKSGRRDDPVATNVFLAASAFQYARDNERAQRRGPSGAKN
jgi:hypothetical protein